MNRDPVTTAIAVILLLSVTATAGLCYWFLQCTRQHQVAQAEWNRLNRNRTLLQALAVDTVEYSKKNPAIVPLLESFGLRARMDTNTAGIK
jgi:hypothetical protein